MEDTIKEVEKTVFSTRDMSLASTLVTLQCYMIGVDYQQEGDMNRPVGYFNFEDTSELRDIESKYWRGELLVEPRTFVTNLRSLKARVTNMYKNPNSPSR